MVVAAGVEDPEFSGVIDGRRDQRRPATAQRHRATPVGIGAGDRDRRLGTGPDERNPGVGVGQQSHRTVGLDRLQRGCALAGSDDAVVVEVDTEHRLGVDTGGCVVALFTGELAGVIEDPSILNITGVVEDPKAPGSVDGRRDQPRPVTADRNLAAPVGIGAGDCDRRLGTGPDERNPGVGVGQQCHRSVGTDRLQLRPLGIAEDLVNGG